MLLLNICVLSLYWYLPNNALHRRSPSQLQERLPTDIF